MVQIAQEYQNDKELTVTELSNLKLFLQDQRLSVVRSYVDRYFRILRSLDVHGVSMIIVSVLDR